MEQKAKRSRGAFFLKALDGDFSKQLLMPLAFTKYFNGEIPHWLIIEIAGTRKCWRVDVEDDGTGALHFTDGWDDFAEANALEFGNILLFEYKKPLILEVTIFDKDGVEKLVGQTSEFESFKTEDPEHQRGNSNTCHAAEASRLSTRTDKNSLPDEDGFEKSVGQTSEFEEYEVEDSEHQQKTSNTHHAEEASRRSTRIDNAHEKQQEVVDRVERKAARTSISENGLAFSITWRNSNHLYYYLTIPRAIAINMHLSRQEEVVLKDQEGNSWLIKLATRPDGRVDLTRGWREFLNKKNVKAGDTLTLEFCSDNLIQVNVESPAAQVDHPSHTANHCSNKPTSCFNMASERVKPAANCDENHQTPDTSQNTERGRTKFRRSSFSVTWRETTRGNYLSIPKNIAKEQDLLDYQSIVVCDEEGAHWQMEIRIKPNDGRFYLSRGWSEFRRRNGIVVGDTLNFEFVSIGMAKVSIIRASKAHDGAVGVSEWVHVKQETV